MRLLSPCKNCIVQPMCNKICPDREDLKKTYLKIIHTLSIFLMFITSLLIVIIFDGNKPAIGIIGLIQFFGSGISIILQYVLKEIRKTNKQMSERRFGEHRVYGFDR